MIEVMSPKHGISDRSSMIDVLDGAYCVISRVGPPSSVFHHRLHKPLSKFPGKKQVLADCHEREHVVLLRDLDDSCAVIV